MAWTAYRRVTVGQSCDFCLMLATRGAVYKSADVAKYGFGGHRYHDHCDCEVELESNVMSKYDVKIDPAEVKREVLFRNNGRTYRYDLTQNRHWRFSPPPAPNVAPTVPVGLRDIPRGAPERLGEAILRTNPKWGTGRKYQYNCTRCVVAGELRVRGYQVTAGKALGDYSEIVAKRTFRNVGWADWVAPRAGRVANIGEGLPDGARLWVRYNHKGTSSGHILMAQREAGKTVFYDPQVGQVNTVREMTGKMSKIRYLRVDDLELADDGIPGYVEWE